MSTFWMPVTPLFIFLRTDDEKVVKGGVKTYRRGGVTVDHPVTRWSPSVQPVLRRRYDFGGRPSEPEDESRRRSLLCLSR